MNCEQVQYAISRRIDGEITPEDELTLEAHVQECSECRTTEVALRLQDAELRRAFAGPRARAAQVADTVIDDLVAPTAPRRRWRGPLAIAASLLLLAAAYVQFGRDVQPSILPQAAVLTVALGPIDVQASGAKGWDRALIGAPIDVGARVRTSAEARCELRLVDGSLVRLDSSSELRFAGQRHVALARGRMWSSVGGAAAPLEVDAPGGQVSMVDARADMLAKPAATELLLLHGRAQVSCQGRQLEVAQGQALAFGADGIGQPQAVSDPITYTRWVHPILARKGPNDPELTARIATLLAMFEQTDISPLYENEIRACGFSAARSLSRYVQSAGAFENPEARIRVAGILADVADPSCIPDMIEMLADHTPDIRYAAARALQRLTGEDQGRTPDQWRDTTAVTCDDPHVRWQKWWQDNKQHYGQP